MKRQHRLGWNRRKRTMPQLEAMVRFVITFGDRWGWRWAMDFLLAALIGEDNKKKRQALRRWNKWSMHRKERT